MLQQRRPSCATMVPDRAPISPTAQRKCARERDGPGLAILKVDQVDSLLPAHTWESEQGSCPCHVRGSVRRSWPSNSAAALLSPPSTNPFLLPPGPSQLNRPHFHHHLPPLPGSFSCADFQTVSSLKQRLVFLVCCSVLNKAH